MPKIIAFILLSLTLSTRQAQAASVEPLKLAQNSLSKSSKAKTLKPSAGSVFEKPTKDSAMPPKLCFLTSRSMRDEAATLMAWIKNPQRGENTSKPDQEIGSNDFLQIESYEIFEAKGLLLSDGLKKALTLLPSDCRIFHFHYNPEMGPQSRSQLYTLKKIFYKKPFREAFLIAPSGQKRVGYKKKRETVAGTSLLGSLQGVFFVGQALRNGTPHPSERNGDFLSLYSPFFKSESLNEAAAQFSGYLLQELIKNPTLRPKEFRQRARGRSKTRLQDYFELLK